MRREIKWQTAESRVFSLLRNARANLYEIAKAVNELLKNEKYLSADDNRRDELNAELSATFKWNLEDLNLMYDYCSDKTEWKRYASKDLYRLKKDAWLAADIEKRAKKIKADNAGRDRFNEKSPVISGKNPLPPNASGAVISTDPVRPNGSESPVHHPRHIIAGDMATREVPSKRTSTFNTLDGLFQSLSQAEFDQYVASELFQSLVNRSGKNCPVQPAPSMVRAFRAKPDVAYCVPGSDDLGKPNDRMSNIRRPQEPLPH
ncbi:MAG: hypothetical protein ACHP8A_20345 [Terriglobales bacterium]